MNQAQLLVKYQEVDKKLKQVEDEFNSNDAVKKFVGSTRALEQIKEKLPEIDQRAKALTEAYNFAITEAGKLDKQVKGIEKKALSCESEEELIALKKQLDDVKAKVAQNDQKIEETVKAMNELYKEYAELGKKNAEMVAVRKEFGPKAQASKVEFDKKKAEIRAELEKIAKDIDKELMNKYLLKRKDKKFPIVFGLDLTKNSSHCPRCATQLFSGFVSDLRQGKILECESCRMLIYGDDGSVK